MLDLHAEPAAALTGLDADRLAETLGMPPVAPLAMPRQILEHGRVALRAGLVQRLSALFGLGTARAGH